MPLVEVRNLVKHFERGGGFLRAKSVVRAVDDVSFDIEEGETYGLVGESGSGKSTTGRCMLRLIEPTSGQVRFRGDDVLAFDKSRMRAARRDMQMVFQDPYSSLNPRMRARDIVEEPLIIHNIGARGERRDKVTELFGLVGLDPAHLERYPHEFSGGQRQRIGLARALALNPSFVIADEPVSALDVSIQAQVVNLLLDLQERLNLTYLFIAHDLRLVRHICTRLSVMYLGKTVESGNTASIFANPQHPYTRALLSAIPVTDPDAPRHRIELDPQSVNRDAPLREVATGHFAAV
ncbi:MAG TPA: ATP-binding cassette domain-containing protein [Vicinamibacterales bacterium]|nr:ATP-binding cassette domain-containing protein [Vicinamibacterales bacterium]